MGGGGLSCKRGEVGYIFELVNAPGMVFVRPVAGEIGRGDICNNFGLNPDDLYEFESAPRPKDCPRGEPTRRGST